MNFLIKKIIFYKWEQRTGTFPDLIYLYYDFIVKLYNYFEKRDIYSFKRSAFIRSAYYL